jgi:hypothetical protein
VIINLGHPSNDLMCPIAATGHSNSVFYDRVPCCLKSVVAAYRHSNLVARNSMWCRLQKVSTFVQRVDFNVLSGGNGWPPQY